MTQRLYLDDSFRTDFPARVVATGEHEGRPFAELEASCFYPESGGQLADRGWLDGIPVVDVREQGERVLHFLERPLAADRVGRELAGRVDREVRLDHLQQHSGQHLLSAALVELFGIPTLSFHMGIEGCTIDVDRAEVAAAELQAAEDLVNRRIQEDRPVRVLYPSAAELAGMALRKDPQVPGQVRVVEVEGFDRSPCCGTHCSRTGQLGQLHVRRAERVRQKARIHFVVGMRALADHRAKNAALLDLGAALSVPAGELGSRVRDLLEKQRETGRTLALVQADLWARQAVDLVASARPVGAVRLLVSCQDRSPAERKTMAERLGREPDLVAALATPAGDLTLAAGTATGVDCAGMFGKLAKALGGKGGGQKAVAQGRIEAARVGELAGQLETLLGGCSAAT